MTETQKGLFKLLIELDEICKKHSIIYYLIGGSALGAVRHNGFLPWDDDADIVLTRENWEKLKKAFETDLPPNRAYVSWENCDEEPSVFFRYVNTQQCFIHHSLWDHAMPWGGIVDIFVLNPLPSDPKKWDNYHRTMRRFGEYIMNSFIVMNEKSSLLMYLWDCFTGRIKGSDYVKRYLYQKLSKYSESECTHYSYLYSRIHIIYPKEIFQAPRYVLFEGRMMPVPTLAEEHFRILFGDDWYTIPLNSTITTHNAIHDNNRSYKEYMYDYMHYTKRVYVRELSKKAKILKMLRFKVQHIQNTYIAKLRKKYLEKLFDKEFSCRSLELEAMHQKRAYYQIGKKCACYYSEQLLPIMEETNQWIPISNQYFELVLRTLVAEGNNRKAQKIINLYLTSHRNCPGFWAELSKLLERKNQLFIAYETGDHKTAIHLAQELFEIYEYDKDIRILYLYLELEHRTCKDIDTLLKIAEDGQQLWPDAVEFQKIQADILERQGAHNKANRLYEMIISNTNNGMILLALQKKGISLKGQV